MSGTDMDCGLGDAEKWRSEHADELLPDEDAVNALPEGTVVELVWSGGNGPHTYTVVKSGDISCVDTTYEDAITFVGTERYHTNVRVVEYPGHWHLNQQAKDTCPICTPENMEEPT